jgi:hypothetical protein
MTGELTYEAPAAGEDQDRIDGRAGDPPDRIADAVTGAVTGLVVLPGSGGADVVVSTHDTSAETLTWDPGTGVRIGTLPIAVPANAVVVHTGLGVLLAGTVNDHEIVVLDPAGGAMVSGPFQPHAAGVKTLCVLRLAGDFGTLIGHRKGRFSRHHGSGAGIGSCRSASSLGTTSRSASFSGATGSEVAEGARKEALPASVGPKAPLLPRRPSAGLPSTTWLAFAAGADSSCRSWRFGRGWCRIKVSILLIDARHIRPWSILVAPEDHARVVLDQPAGNTRWTFAWRRVLIRW